MGFPVQDISRLEELATGFSEHSSGILDGCVLALDGFGVPTRQPFDLEVERPQDIAWQDSELFEAIEVEKLLPTKYFVIGDEAFNCTNQMLSPWPGKIFFTYLILYYILIKLF